MTIHLLIVNYVKKLAVMNVELIAIYAILGHAKNVIQDVIYVIKIYV